MVYLLHKIINIILTLVTLEMTTSASVSCLHFRREEIFYLKAL
jgi:hypothetical protein